MKKITVLLICVIFMHVANAQWSNKWLSHTDHKHLLYTHGDVMVGNNSGGNLGMSFVFNSKYSVEIGYSASSNQVLPTFPEMLKSAYKSEAEDIIALPDEMLENYHMMMGRHFNLNSKGTFRLVVQGGPGMSVILNSVGPDNMVSFADKMQEFSLMVNTKIEIPIIDMLGFSAGPTLVMNQERQDLTFCVGFIYGITTTN